MSFFNEQGPICPLGTQYGTVTNVEIRPMASFDDPSKQELRTCFTYLLTTKNEATGQAYELFDYTGTTYGNDQAKLTKRLKSMFPPLTPKERACLEPSDMIGKQFVLEVVHRKNRDGQLRAVIEYIKPYTPQNSSPPPPMPPSPPVPQENAADEEDPFASSNGFDETI